MEFLYLQPITKQLSLQLGGSGVIVEYSSEPTKRFLLDLRDFKKAAAGLKQQQSSNESM